MGHDLLADVALVELGALLPAEILLRQIQAGLLDLASEFRHLLMFAASRGSALVAAGRSIARRAACRPGSGGTIGPCGCGATGGSLAGRCACGARTAAALAGLSTLGAGSGGELQVHARQLGSRLL